jgi:hypothetical protein
MTLSTKSTAHAQPNAGSKPIPLTDQAERIDNLVKLMREEEVKFILKSILLEQPELIRRTAQQVRGFLTFSDPSVIADTVESSVTEIDQEFFETLSHADITNSKDRLYETVHTMFIDILEPLIHQLQRQVTFGFYEDAIRSAQGIMHGLYRLRNRTTTGILRYAPKSVFENAITILEIADDIFKKIHPHRLTLPSLNIGEEFPDWVQPLSKEAKRFPQVWQEHLDEQKLSETTTNGAAPKHQPATKKVARKAKSGATKAPAVEKQKSKAPAKNKSGKKKSDRKRSK